MGALFQNSSTQLSYERLFSAALFKCVLCFLLLLIRSQASALGTTIDLFLRLPTDSIRSYEALVPTNPIFYKACTSGVAYTIGDFVSQVSEMWLTVERVVGGGVAMVRVVQEVLLLTSSTVIVLEC
jgi:hypothetical protein